MEPIFLTVHPDENTIVQNNREIAEKANPRIDYSNVVCKKPWGHEFLVYESKNIGIWCLMINASHATSLHTHFHKDTFVIVLDGCAKLETPDGGVQALSILESVHIPRNKFHALGAFSPKVTLLEIEIFQEGAHFSDKNDLLRINDIYHRKSTGYESSVDVTKEKEELESYGHFMIGDEPISQIIRNTQIEVSTKLDSKAQYNILLEGQVFHKGVYFSPGSLLPVTCQLGHNNRILSIYYPFYYEDTKIIYSNDHLVAVKKQEKERVILTSGCYDIIHVGHLNTLRNAKNIGGKLMVCLSSDEQITKLKGDGRPINKYQDRIDLFKTIAYVDYIVLYNEENNETEKTLGEIMKLVNPYCWVKGSDYTKEQILAKHPYLTNIVLFNNIDGKSTTNIVKHIQKSSV